jgi:two-component system invasion response regulator UvrY
MFRSVAVFRVVAATDVTAAPAQPQVHPGIADLEALLAADCIAAVCLDRIEVRAFQGVDSLMGRELMWRREWDSNPRWYRYHGGFQDRCLKPLGHLSMSAGILADTRGGGLRWRLGTTTLAGLSMNGGAGMNIRVFVVDDHALVRAGMRMILEGQDDIEVVGEADCGEEALPQIRKLKPDVVLCDLHLPGVSGLELTERILKGDHGTRVIVVSVLEDGPMPKRLLEIGASGYVGKGGDASELLRAVRDVARGKRYLASGIAQNLALYGISGDGSPFDALSPRELEVAMLLTQGLRQEDIAKRLSLSAKTVNTHKTRLFEKLGIRDSIALARLAGQYGVANPADALLA